ncbi:hypothetical protein OC845_006769 [Tilletia horrida]|nr:hypothetical protein OC845_006769 [Tilletia horrida]
MPPAPHTPTSPHRPAAAHTRSNSSSYSQTRPRESSKTEFYQIGKNKFVPGFVTAEHLRAHLALLSVFRQLREDVGNGTEAPVAPTLALAAPTSPAVAPVSTPSRPIDIVHSHRQRASAPTGVASSHPRPERELPDLPVPEPDSGPSFGRQPTRNRNHGLPAYSDEVLPEYVDGLANHRHLSESVPVASSRTAARRSSTSAQAAEPSSSSRQRSGLPTYEVASSSPPSLEALSISAPTTAALSSSPSIRTSGLPAQSSISGAQISDAVKQQRWRSYLTRAAARLDLYVTQILDPISVQNANFPIPPHPNEFDPNSSIDPPQALVVQPAHLPPIDVLLMWHTFLLNPARFWEDVLLEPALNSLHRVQFPLFQMASAINPETRQFETPQAAAHWNSKIPMWDFYLTRNPPENPILGPSHPGAGKEGMTIPCPHCGLATFVPWSSPPGSRPARSLFLSGLDDVQWWRSCMNQDCKKMINVDSLRGKRFARDLKRWTKEHNFRLAGTLLSLRTGKLIEHDIPDGALSRDLISSDSIAASISKHGVVLRHALDLSDHFATTNMYSFKLMSQVILQHTSSKSHRNDEQLKTMFAEYGEHSGIGLPLTDLVKSAQELFRFNDDMARLDWIKPGGIVNTEAIERAGSLPRAVKRYHLYVDLLSQETALLCPTLDIDLCLHTHLLSRTYIRDMVNYVGRFVNHFDQIERQTLTAAYERTAARWQFLYGIPYSNFANEVSSPGATSSPPGSSAGRGSPRSPSSFSMKKRMSSLLSGGGSSKNLGMVSSSSVSSLHLPSSFLGAGSGEAESATTAVTAAAATSSRTDDATRPSYHAAVRAG